LKSDLEPMRSIARDRVHLTGDPDRFPVPHRMSLQVLLALAGEGAFLLGELIAFVRHGLHGKIRPSIQRPRNHYVSNGGSAPPLPFIPPPAQPFRRFGTGIEALQLCILTFQQNCDFCRNVVGGEFDRVRRKMGITCSGLNLSVAEEFSDHGQTLSSCYGRRGKCVSQIVDADVLW
jgi:hypothetical protein